jgi:predicted enzyme related to lactoylglutathione lyase
MGNPVMKWQMISKDPEGSAAFYGKVFGWQIQANNRLGYRVVDTCSEEGIDGGIWPAPPGASTFVQLFVEVVNVADAVKDAVANGATVVVAPQVLPDGDEMAVLLDPQGMSLGVMRSARE